MAHELVFMEITEKQWTGKDYNAKFTCPVCGRETRTLLCFLGTRCVLCDGDKIHISPEIPGCRMSRVQVFFLVVGITLVYGSVGEVDPRAPLTVAQILAGLLGLAFSIGALATARRL
jgi:hypothetical protein